MKTNISGADKSLARTEREQARKHVRQARDLKKIETRAVIKLFFLEGKTPKENHAILTETLACFLPSLQTYFSEIWYFSIFFSKIFKENSNFH